MKRCLLLPIFLISYNILFAQVDREFWFAIPKETSGHGTLTATNNVSFKITAMNLDAHVSISMPANGAFITRIFTVPAGKTRVEPIASSWAEFETIYNNSAAFNAVPVTGINNRGFLIQADNDITVYYDYDNNYNRELFALKGKNALGTDFFVPFQNIWYNDSASYNPSPFSTADIVATEDGTELIITPQPGQRIHGRLNDSTFNVNLNRGQSYCLRAMYRKGSAHLSGIRIQSNKPIAVSTNDDSYRISGTISCRDIIGDQIVPTSVIGSEYVVMTGDRSINTTGALSAPYKYPSTVGEQIFVVASASNTQIQFWGKDGSTLLYTTPVLGAGQTDYMSVDINNTNMSSIYIKATDLSKKFYVFHITGIGCELGGAILPPITDCTGSNEVSFYRSNTLSDITINLMIPYDNTKSFSDPSQPHYYFKMVHYPDSVVADTIAIPGSWFEENAGSGWAVLKMAYRNFNSFTTAGHAHKIINNKNFFHMGMTSGTTGVAGKYGYFSSFNISQANARTAETEESNYIGCYGDTITLVANGGLEYTWHYGTPAGPPTYLSDPKSPTPQIINCPVGSHNFYVEVQQAKCFGIDTLKVSINILPIPIATFLIDKSTVCSNDVVQINNYSVNADIFKWKKQIGSGPDTLFYPLTDSSFTDTVYNKSMDPIKIKYTLIAESYQGCSDTVSSNVSVIPKVNASFSPKDTTGYSPLYITFKNLSSGTANNNYQWSFGDGSESLLSEPLHVFSNYTQDTIEYKVKLLVTSSYACNDSTSGTIRVMPLIDNAISKAKDPLVSVYPVPSNGKISIQYTTKNPSFVNIELYTTTGKLIYSHQEYKTQIGKNITKLNTNKIADKFFVIKVTVADKVYTFKGIKE